jgi:hypothetical protein
VKGLDVESPAGTADELTAMGCRSMTRGASVMPLSFVAVPSLRYP